jgi:signal peptidase
MQIGPEEFVIESSATEPRAELVDRICCELVAEAARAGREVRVRVTGTSMLPSIWPGDTLVARALAGSSPTNGEILLFIREGRLFAHRLVRRLEQDTAAVLVTRGDALSDCDPPLAESEILGSVAALSRGGRTVPLGAQRLSLPMKMLALVFRHSNPLRRVILKLHDIRRRWSQECANLNRLEGPSRL